MLELDDSSIRNRIQERAALMGIGGRRALFIGYLGYNRWMNVNEECCFDLVVQAQTKEGLHIFRRPWQTRLMRT